jgi:hypothetical protein
MEASFTHKRLTNLTKGTMKSKLKYRRRFSEFFGKSESVPARYQLIPRAWRPRGLSFAQPNAVPFRKLSSIIWGRYGNDELEKLYCPHCKAPEKCACKIVLVPYDADVATLKSYAAEVLSWHEKRRSKRQR